MLRILHILDHSVPLHSGYTFRTCEILSEQKRLGFETFQVTGPKHTLAARTDSEQEYTDGLHFYRTPLPSGLLAKLPIFNQWAVVIALQKRLQQIIKEIKPHVLHAHSPALNGKAAIRVSKQHNLPVLYEIRAFWEDAAVDHGTSSEWGTRYRVSRMLETSVIKQAAAVTTICEGLRSDIIARGIDARKVTVIPNAVNIEKFSLCESVDPILRQHLGLDGKTVLGFIGSFYAYEGLDVLLQALPKIRTVKSDVCILLVGGGPDDAKLQRLVKTLDIEKHVVFAGRVSHDEITRYYDLVDLFVYPRLSMRLTELVTPLKPLEAMARGRLVVASDVGGHRELIRSGETGELFKAGDSEALAQAVIRLMLQKETWSRRCRVARHYVEQERTWSKSVAKYRTIYESLVANKQARNQRLGKQS